MSDKGECVWSMPPTTNVSTSFGGTHIFPVTSINVNIIQKTEVPPDY